MINGGVKESPPLFMFSMNRNIDSEMTYLHRLCMNIRNGHFSWQRYKAGGRYFGREIAVMPLFCSYGQIGYSVYFPYQSSMPEINYDWELKELTVDDMAWKDFFAKE